MEKLQPIPHGYEESLDSVIGVFENLNQPRFKGYIKITARPAGTRSTVSEELYCMDKDPSSHQKIFETVCRLLQKARNIYGKKDFHFEILNRRNDSLLNIRVNVSRRVLEVVPLPNPPKIKQKPRPETRVEDRTVPPPQDEMTLLAFTVPVATSNVQNEPVPAEVVSEPAEVVSESAADIPSPATAFNGVPESRGGLVTCPNPDAKINYELMKSFPTEAKPVNIRRAFEVCGIQTYGDILRRLGTTEPTGADWETFITGIRTQAEQGGVKFWNSSGWILYWWLNEKMRWIKPFL